MFTDIHTHLNFLEISPEVAVQNALASGVHRMITIGTEPGDLPIVLKLADQFSPHVYCTLGIHPHEAKLLTPEVEQYLRENLKNPRVVAVGEIGLDYFYDQSPRDVQRDAFRKQLNLCCEFDLPFEIHTRDAEQDTVNILKEYEGKIKGVIHCFTGTEWLARECLALGHNISLSGILTFKNAQSLREVATLVPLDRLHVETDAPYLTPAPHRGRPNEPKMVLHTAEFLANLKGISVEELARVTELNLRSMFPRINDAI